MTTNVLLTFVIIIQIMIFGEISDLKEDLKKIDKKAKFNKSMLGIIDDTVNEMYQTYSFDCGSLHRIEKEMAELNKPKVNPKQRWIK